MGTKKISAFAPAVFTAYLLAVISILSSPAMADIVQPTGINPTTGAPWEPGEYYRLAFMSSAVYSADSKDIEHYNALMQTAAEAAGLGEAIWKVIGSTDTVDARDNTSTNPEVDGVGCPILLVDGSTVIAVNNADLWDGEILHAIDQTEFGDYRMDWVITGTYLNGLKAPGNGEGSSYSAFGGGGNIQQGRSDVTTEWIWRTWTGSESPHSMYALSEPLFVGGVDPNTPGVDAGDDRITWSGQGVLLDPNVVNNDNLFPKRDLLYEWSSSSEGVTFFPDSNVMNPFVTITRPALGDVNEVTLELAVTLEGGRTSWDTMSIFVYDDECQAGINIGRVLRRGGDFDGNCITDLGDLYLLAASWLDDYNIDELMMVAETWLDGEVLTAPETVSLTVPNVIDYTESAAQVELTGLGFTTTSNYKYSRDIPVDDVFVQVPAADTSVPDGINVSMDVSQGPPPVTETTIAKVYLGQTHVHEPTQNYFKLTGNRPALLKAQVLAPNGTPAPPVTAVLTVDGQSTTITLNGPSTLVDNFEALLGRVEHRLDDSFTALIPAAWIKPGLNIAVNAGNDSVSYDIKVGAPSVIKLKMFDIHYFGPGSGSYPEDAFEELESKWPVSDLIVERVEEIKFPEIAWIARDGAPYVRVSSSQDYKNQTGIPIDGEQSTAHTWIAALVAAGGSNDLAMHYINIIGNGSGGSAWDFRGVGTMSTGILNHELGHTFNLPHWGDAGRYPYKGEIYGIEPQPTVNMGTHVGPIWGLDLRSLTFIPPTVQEDSVGGVVGRYKRSPMQGGGSGDQEIGYNFRHFSDFGINEMQTYLENKVAVLIDGNYYKWSRQNEDYTISIASNGVNLPIQEDVDVISLMASATIVDPNVNIAYPPIGPYQASLIRTFDPTVAADRADADAIYCPDGGCDFTLRVTQGGVEKHYMLPAEAVTGSKYDNNTLKTTAVNIPASDGTVTKVELLLTPDAEKNGLPPSPDVLDTWTK